MVVGRMVPRASIPCSALPKPVASFRSSFGGTRFAPASVRARRAAVVRGVFASNPVTDVGKYLGEAAKQIFSPTNTADQPSWEGTGNAFSGSIEHHEKTRLRALYTAVQSTRAAITGCTDPDASNFNPDAVVDDGTCNYIAQSVETGLTDNLRGYVTDTLARVFSSNFKGDDTEPKDWASMGYSYRGERVSQRDIMRLLQYEKVVKKALDEVEEESS